MRLVDANAFKMFLEVVRQDYLEKDPFSSDFAAKVIETLQDEYLANAPTVDAVEVVHGRWVSVGGNQYTIFRRCSICCAMYDFTPHYCPNCGADMRERKDND
jgi:hypothetical protein